MKNCVELLIAEGGSLRCHVSMVRARNGMQFGESAQLSQGFSNHLTTTMHLLRARPDSRRQPTVCHMHHPERVALPHYQ
ncbi:Uncharacterized protein APZ42_031311 [Daphnia magna]|uniref:Uncharacterized protein n=2 Tax=Daphnia magna TaxID=35525 RepID=A0A0P5CXF8_9CRUS|nr:hypothetical protein OUZ56_026647 [Daphnia magna]KZS05485.1 Uncharacterized protein APZ42_031311 [Daphnia magna]